MPPSVSVILPVYNAGVYLRAAIESILSQTYKDFELIIINDGSTDDSANSIAEYTDSRITSVQQENQGLRAALNVGIGMSKGTYIARMDQDDVSLPLRLQKQVEYLNTHTQCVVLGTTYAYMNGQGEITGAFPALLEDFDIKRELLTKSPFGHGTVMLRASTLRAGPYFYDNAAVHVEDYDLWLRLAKTGTFANLPETLYLWRRSAASTTSTHGQQQKNSARRLQERSFEQSNMKEILEWPGWSGLHRYHNERQMVQGVQVNIRRRDAHASMYAVIAWMLLRRGKLIRAFRAMVYVLLANPGYIVKAAIRRLALRS